MRMIFSPHLNVPAKRGMLPSANDAAAGTCNVRRANQTASLSDSGRASPTALLPSLCAQHYSNCFLNSSGCRRMSPTTL